MKLITNLFIFIISIVTIPCFAEQSKEFIAHELMDMGYDIFYLSNSGDNALHLATKKQNLKAINLLISYGFSVDRTNKAGDTALHIAADKDSSEIMQTLIDYGANIQFKNKLGQSPYHKALAKSNQSALHLLVEHGYQPEDILRDYLIAKNLQPDLIDKAGNTFLHRLAQSKNIELMKAVLDQGYSLNVFNKKNETPFYFALKNNDVEMLSLMQNYHIEKIIFTVDLQLVTKQRFKESLDFLFHYYYEDVVTSINNYNEKGINSFHYALAGGDEEIILLLIENGADLNLHTHSGYHYGPNDPIHWNSHDWDGFAEFGNLDDLRRYQNESGFIHPVASPLAILTYFHPELENLKDFMEERGAKYEFHHSIKSELLDKYLK